jgi:gamma-glutamylcyclotransferase (GGCT)/AIG2-like uncharacterized protein YtfP
VSEPIAFYGSLRRSFGVQQRLGIHSRLRYLRPCLLRGRLYDLGAYPALLPGDGLVRAELYEPLYDRLIGFLDEFEGYDPQRPKQSQYLRRLVELIEPRVAAWVYLYNQSVEGRPLIDAGCWESYRRKVKAAAEPRS